MSHDFCFYRFGIDDAVMGDSGLAIGDAGIVITVYGDWRFCDFVGEFHITIPSFSPSGFPLMLIYLVVRC